MTNYDDAPEAAEASLTAAGDAVFRAQDALDDAEQRVNAAERDVDAAHGLDDAEAEAAALQRMQEIEREIEVLRQDLASTEAYANSNIQYWLES